MPSPLRATRREAARAARVRRTNEERLSWIERGCYVATRRMSNACRIQVRWTSGFEHVQVTLRRRRFVTTAPSVAVGLYNSAADVPPRRRFALAGGHLAPNTVVARWSGTAATLRSILTGDEAKQPFDWLVIAGTALARSDLSAELARLGVAHVSIGDCVAPRTAAAAILDGRRVALAI